MQSSSTSTSEDVPHAHVLRLIGRHVTIILPQSMVFEGLIAFVTKDTIVLKDVYRYTVKEIAQRERIRNFPEEHAEWEKKVKAWRKKQAKKKKEEEERRRLEEERKQQQQEGTVTVPIIVTSSGDNNHNNDDDKFEIASDDDTTANSNNNRSQSVAATSATTTTTTTAGGTNRESYQRGEEECNEDLPPHLREPKQPDPLPVQIPFFFATISQKRVQKIQFANQPAESYRGSAQPSEQHLRVFVRRFIIHDKQGNNPTNMTMLSFLKQRLKWDNPNEQLVEQLTEEEKRELQQSEDAIINERIQQREEAERLRRFRAEMENAAAPAAAAGDNNEGNDGGLAHVPFGSGSDDEADDFLYLASIPARTGYLAILHMVIAITTLLYSASVFSSTEKYLLNDFLYYLTIWVVSASSCHLLMGGVTGYHAVKMRIPVSYPLLVMRGTVLLLFLAFMTSTVLAVNFAMFRYQNILSFQTLEEKYIDLVANSAPTICGIEVAKKCSGWDIGCAVDYSAVYCAEECGQQSSLSAPCGPIYEQVLQDTVLPVLILTYMQMVVALFDAFLYVMLLCQLRDLNQRGLLE